MFNSNIIIYEVFRLLKRIPWRCHRRRSTRHPDGPEKGQDTRVKITDAVEDFLKKHNIKLSRKEVVDLVDDIQDAAEEE